MSYAVVWGDHETEVDTAAELDAVLDRVEAAAADAGMPYSVEITSTIDYVRDPDGQPWLPYGLVVGVGHVDRSFATFVGEPRGGTAYSPDLPAPPEPMMVHDCGCHEPTRIAPEQLRITPVQAREAAREFVTTGQRPTRLAWDDMTEPDSPLPK